MFLRIIKFSTLIIVLNVSVAEAARVTQAKNNKVMIDLEGESAQPGQDLYLMNKQNKKVAIGKISQVKNGKAVATILKGKATGDETVQLSAPVAENFDDSATANRPSKANSTFVRTNAKKVSIVANYMNNNMAILEADANANEETVATTGSSFGVTGVLDWPLKYKLSVRGTAGYEPFKTTGTSKYLACDNRTSKECSTDITYFSTGAYLRYDFYQGQALVWAAGGATIKQPMSKSTTALKQDDIKMTLTYAAAAGVDYFIDHKYFIPFSIEQQFFLKSSTVDANTLFVRAGFGMAL